MLAVIASAILYQEGEMEGREGKGREGKEEGRGKRKGGKRGREGKEEGGGEGKAFSTSFVSSKLPFIMFIYCIVFVAHKEPMKIGEMDLTWKQQYIAFAVGTLRSPFFPLLPSILQLTLSFSHTYERKKREGKKRK